MSSAGAIINDLQGSGSVNLGYQYLTLKNAQSTYAGVISGFGGLNIDNGNFTLTRNNTYTGSTTIASAATLNLGIDNALSSTNVMINGGTLNIDTFNATVGDVIMVSGSIDGTGTLYGTSFTLGGDTLITANIDIAAPTPMLMSFSSFSSSSTTRSKKSSSYYYNDNSDHEREDEDYKPIKQSGVITLATINCNLNIGCRGSSLKLGSDDNLGNNLIRILDGAYLDLNGRSISNNLELNGFGIGAGSLINTSSTTAKESGSILLGSSRYQLIDGSYSYDGINSSIGISTTGSIILSGRISGSGSK
ncbi:MAG: hypothetical protein EBS46_03855 [Proteobacteria bacterium]|nr:hypothetical protein [Candidatus Fonsibacter sp. PEL4]